MLMDLLWSDPTTNDGVQGVQPSPRGPGLVTFGPDRVKDFCKVIQLSLRCVSALQACCVYLDQQQFDQRRFHALCPVLVVHAHGVTQNVVSRHCCAPTLSHTAHCIVNSASRKLASVLLSE